ncbi:MAG: hypothetical protein HZA91_12885 [Verrucomicrobia bacterium]|nr:hypothetical protein [Verrucomicrobiota bacterium]
MQKRRRHHHGSGASDFMMWSVFVLFLVFGTMWLVTHFYNSDWAPSDPRSTEAQSNMARATAEQATTTPGPSSLPPPAFSDFKRTEPPK